MRFCLAFALLIALFILHYMQLYPDILLFDMHDHLLTVSFLQT